MKPTAITGDMHSINKANFAILHWFGLRFEPHFTDLNRQLQELYCIRDPAAYKKFLIQPAGQIDLDLIIRAKSHLDRIVATLGLKEMTQGRWFANCARTPRPIRPGRHYSNMTGWFAASIH